MTYPQTDVDGRPVPLDRSPDRVHPYRRRDPEDSAAHPRSGRATQLRDDDDLLAAQALASADGAGASRFDLVASAEPAVVFASLAERCVPAVCDACAIDIDDDGATYRLAQPADGIWLPNLALTDPGQPTTVQHLRLKFADPVNNSYTGVATFGWRRRQPTAGEQLLIEMMMKHAVSTIAWQRGERTARDAVSKAEHLGVALQSSRQIGAAIGIIMSLHKVPEAAAFDVLRMASQRSNRKLRDLAVDVIETGWIDPVLLDLVDGRTSTMARVEAAIGSASPGEYDPGSSAARQ